MKDIYKKISLLCIGLILSLIILETFLRIYNPFGFRIKANKLRLQSDVKYIIKNSGFQDIDNPVIHTKNKLGFRGDDPPEDFENYLTIIAVGGSTTEGFFLSDGKSWPEILANRLKKDFRQVWVNNAGFEGFSTFGHIILMEDFIIKLKPKVCLFLIGVNDIARGETNDYDSLMLKFRNFKTAREFIQFLLDHTEIGNVALNLHRHFKARRMNMITPSVHTIEEAVRTGKWEQLEKKCAKDLEAKAKDLHKDNFLRPFEERLKKLIWICRGGWNRACDYNSTYAFG